MEYGFQVRTYSGFLILPITKHHHNRTYDAEREARGFTSTGSTELLCTFIGPHRPSVARMTCRLSDSPVLRLILSFDFESRPCLLITESVGTMNSRENLQQSRLWELSDPVKEPLNTMEDSSNSDLHPETEQLHEIPETDFHVKSYFFRCDETGNNTGRLPPELTATGDPVWVSLTAPQYLGDRSNSWLFAITRTRPGNEKASVGIKPDLVLRDHP